MKKIFNVIRHPLTPFASFGLLLLVNGIFHGMGADTLCVIAGALLTGVMVVSAVCNLAYYGKGVKIVLLVLCAFTALYSGVEMSRLGSDPSHAPAAGIENTRNTGSGGHYAAPSVGYGSAPRSTGNTCPTCGGEGFCTACHGDGMCTNSNCILGKDTCTRCYGTGDCEVCYGLGKSIVGDTRCSRCWGSGKCSKCGGVGEFVCASCGGTGECWKCHGDMWCPTCGGSGIV